jgi:hypothetical protein
MSRMLEKRLIGPLWRQEDRNCLIRILRSLQMHVALKDQDMLANFQVLPDHATNTIRLYVSTAENQLFQLFGQR